MYQDLRKDEETKDIPVLVITGVARGQRFEERMMKKAPGIPLPDGYIEKPMKPEGLLELIGKLLKQEKDPGT
jgi:CheY-like chemotaxis protein